MTKEQYEGTPELIFYCEYNPNDFEDRLEIPFTNDYDIKLDFSRDEETKEICINVDLQPKKSNIPRDFFGQNILNVTAIAGKNGIGKSNIFEKILSHKPLAGYEYCIVYIINDHNILLESINNEKHHYKLLDYSGSQIHIERSELKLLLSESCMVFLEENKPFVFAMRTLPDLETVLPRWRALYRHSALYKCLHADKKFSEYFYCSDKGTYITFKIDMNDIELYKSIFQEHYKLFLYAYLLSGFAQINDYDLEEKFNSFSENYEQLEKDLIQYLQKKIEQQNSQTGYAGTLFEKLVHWVNLLGTEQFFLYENYLYIDISEYNYINKELLKTIELLANDLSKGVLYDFQCGEI